MPETRKKRADEVRKRLMRAQPAPQCELDFANAFQLLIATILSAQSTDKMVNKVTPALFARFPTPAALAQADQTEVETLIKSTGFFRNKGKSIRETSRLLTEKYAGEVPRTMDEITELPGVARKTGNVVLGTAYGIPTGIMIDTHAGRLSRRLGLSKETDPVKVERDLCDVFPKPSWVDMGHRFVLHGRYVCKALKPRCSMCPLNELCPAVEAEPEDTWTARAEKEQTLVESRGERDPDAQAESQAAAPKPKSPAKTKVRAQAGSKARSKTRTKLKAS